MRFLWLALPGVVCIAMAAASCGGNGNCNFGSNCADNDGGGDVTVQDAPGTNDGGPTFGDTSTKDSGNCAVTCSGGTVALNLAGQPAGTYTVTVTAVDAGVNSSGTLTLTYTLTVPNPTLAPGSAPALSSTWLSSGASSTLRA